MKNASEWQPTKYVAGADGALRASRDPRHVGVASRLMADLVGRCYAAHLTTHCRGRLLDLGCGTVPLYAAYRELVTETVCVDWAGSAHDTRFLDHVCDLTRPLPLPDGAFDTIILSDVLEHLPEPETLWREMSRVLRPGGKILLNVPFYYWLHETPHDYYRYTEFALRRFAARAGLAVLVLTPIGGAPEAMADIAAKNLARLRKVGRPAAALVQALCGAFVRTRWGRRVSETSAAGFPFGYFMVVEKPGAAQVREGADEAGRG